MKIFITAILLFSPCVMLARERPFIPLLADPREVLMSLEFKDTNILNASVGNFISIFSTRFSKDILLDTGLEGAAFFVINNRGSYFPLETIDGLIGAFFEMRIKDIYFQTRITHISSHLADGSIEEPITYSRESAHIRTAFRIFHYFYVYAGVSYLIHTIPSFPPWSFQTGFNVIFNSIITPFLATDIKWCGENNYKRSLNLQAGIIPIVNFRIYYSFFNGFNPHGQFYNRPSNSHSLGIGILF